MSHGHSYRVGSAGGHDSLPHGVRFTGLHAVPPNSACPIAPSGRANSRSYSACSHVAKLPYAAASARSRPYTANVAYSALHVSDEQDYVHDEASENSSLLLEEELLFHSGKKQNSGL